MQIIPDGVPRRAAPVTTAALISEQLRTQTGGLWGSDEILAAGAAFFDSGMYSRVYSLYEPPDEEMDYGVLNDAGTTVIRPGAAETDPTDIFDLIDAYMAELHIVVPADSWMSPDYAETLVGMSEVWGVSWRG
jgi:hypothetical protein